MSADETQEPTSHLEIAESCARQAGELWKAGDLMEASVVIALGQLHTNLAQAQNNTAIAGIAETYDRAMRIEIEQYEQRRKALTEAPTTVQTETL